MNSSAVAARIERKAALTSPYPPQLTRQSRLRMRGGVEPDEDITFIDESGRSPVELSQEDIDRLTKDFKQAIRKSAKKTTKKKAPKTTTTTTTTTSTALVPYRGSRREMPYEYKERAIHPPYETDVAKSELFNKIMAKKRLTTPEAFIIYDVEKALQKRKTRRAKVIAEHGGPQEKPKKTRKKKQ